MNHNQRALKLYEANQCEEALATLRLAVEVSRDAQSLNNLAWMLVHEEEDLQEAEQLLLEAVKMQPTSYFPYHLLGEIYAEQEQWQRAVEVLTQGIEIKRTINALNNLGSTYYHLGRFDEAASYYLEASASHSDYAAYSHIVCLLEQGDDTEARARVSLFDAHDDAYIGDVEQAELYYRLGDYAEAVRWYAQGWDEYYKQPSWVEAYIYALYKSEGIDAVAQKRALALQDKQLEREDTKRMACDDQWTEADKQENLQQLTTELKQYETLIERIQNGYIPSVTFTPSIKSGCYLFGCDRHGHAEYEK